MSALFTLLLLASASALRVPTLTRRDLVKLPAVAAIAAAAQPAYAVNKLDDIKVLAAKTKSLRSYVRSTSGNRRLFPMDPDSNNYINIERTVLRGKTEVLLPLLAAMKDYAATASLPEDKLKQLQEQPTLLVGHLSELDYYVSKSQKLNSYEEYTSKTTGDIYPGGKVERELEEACDTASDFIALAAGKSVPVRED